MSYKDLPDDIHLKILSYIPYCRLKFNNEPGLVNTYWLKCFRKVNTPCEMRYLLYEQKYCIQHWTHFNKCPSIFDNNFGTII